jgi:hypothetical protein
MRAWKDRQPLVAVALVAACLGAGAAHAQQEITVQGEVVDLSCYLAKGSKGPEHRACAQLCAKKGLPIGLLTPSGDLYLLIDDHNNPDPYDAAKKLAGGAAEVKGKKFVNGGMASIQVLEVTGR